MGNCDVADGHCHLDEGGAGPFDVDFDFDPESTPATPEGVVSVLNGTGPADWPMVLALGRRQPDVVLPQLGIHPWRVPKARDEVDDALGALRGLLEANEHVGLGECGLDKSGAWAETFDNQLYAFRRQVDIAVALRRPLSVHCVRAPSDVLEAVTGVGGRYGLMTHLMTHLMTPLMTPLMTTLASRANSDSLNTRSFARQGARAAPRLGGVGGDDQDVCAAGQGLLLAQFDAVE